LRGRSEPRARSERARGSRGFYLTYGLLDDLDLNIAIPIVTLDMSLDALLLLGALLRSR
jgi:hypothetical protein